MADDLMQYWTFLKEALGATKTATEIWRNTKGAPEGEQREKMEAALETAFTSAEQATALLARELDFPLCRCTFPGTPMLKVGRTRYGAELFRCPKCDDEEPPDSPHAGEPFIVV